ncbi:MAG: SET domain-containing protein-lysine N-methyltransferase [Deltaproteobacteria bacterium]
MARKVEWRSSVALRATVVGKGLFARKLFRKRQAIGHMKGKLITGDDYDPDYVVDMGDLGVLEPHAPFRYLNHSCEPNCELLEWDSKKAPYPQIWVHALRTVRPSEQLTIDYGWPAESAIPCLCGSPSCRGWVVDQAELERVRRRKGRARRAG